MSFISKYKRRVIMASIAIHALGLLAFFTYWILSTDLEIPDEKNQPVPQNNFVQGNDANERNSYDDEKKIDTGKKPDQDYEQGDLDDNKLRELVNDDSYKNMSTEEKEAELNNKFDALARTPVKEVEKAADTVLDAFGVKQDKTKKPMTELHSKENKGQVDYQSLVLYDYEIVDGKYALIYKDKNNVYFKNDPVALSDLEDFERQRLKLIKKAKENKKFRILLDATDNLINNL